VTSRQTSNVPASVRQRLLNLAQERQENFQLLLVRYALERLLYRLSLSEYTDQFVLKGALLFQLWFDLPQRPTRDADFLGYGEAEPQRLVEIFRALTRLAAPALNKDGLTYLPDSVRAEPIREAGGYPGVRVSLTAKLAGAAIPVQCDIGFGDAVTPAAQRSALPVLLQLPAPTLYVYPAETVVAEKLEAIVKLAGYNSRMKDYFDLWVALGFRIRRAVHAGAAHWSRCCVQPQGEARSLAGLCRIPCAVEKCQPARTRGSLSRCHRMAEAGSRSSRHQSDRGGRSTGSERCGA
jgi:hypothetical protein